MLDVAGAGRKEVPGVRRARATAGKSPQAGHAGAGNLW
jgi:hypothetical protein